MLRIVLDSNMFLSGFLFHGMIKTVFDLVLDNKLQLLTSPLLIEEVIKKLQEFEVSKQIQADILLFIGVKGVLIKPKVKVTVCRDEKDNFALELAESSGADYLITRDKDLLELLGGVWKNTKIVTPEDFLALLRSLKLIA